MNIEEVRNLQQQVRAAHDPQPAVLGMDALAGTTRRRFATGVRLTKTPNDYRLSILLASEKDRALLERPATRAIIEKAKGEVDVEVIGVIRSRKAPPKELQALPLRLAIGASVGHFSGGAGTLGFFATRRSDQQPGFVSCNHVLALIDVGKDRDDVIRPPRLDGGAKPSDTIAALDGSYPKLKSGDAKVVDCAFAAFQGAVDHDPVTVPGGRIVAGFPSIVQQLPVTKVGRATGSRPGFVKDVEVSDLLVEYGFNLVTFHGVIRVEPSTKKQFSNPGDSGALVYTDGTFQPVGLLFTDSDKGGEQNVGSAWVFPLAAVTDALKVDLTVA